MDIVAGLVIGLLVGMTAAWPLIWFFTRGPARPMGENEEWD